MADQKFVQLELCAISKGGILDEIGRIEETRGYRCTKSERIDSNHGAKRQPEIEQRSKLINSLKLLTELVLIILYLYVLCYF